MKRFVFGVLLACVIAGEGHAEPAVQQESIVIAVESIDHYPFHRLVGGRWEGLGRDVLDAFAEHSGYKITYEAYPVKRLMQRYVRGEVDARFPDNPRWSSELREGLHIYYSAPVVEVILGTVVKPEKHGLGIEAIRSVGVVRGFTAQAYAELAARETVYLYEGTSGLSLIKKLIKRRLDGVYFSVDSARYIADEILLDPDALVFDSELPYDRFNYLLSSTNNPELVDAFNRFLDENPSVIKKLVDQYDICSLPGE